MEIKRDGVFSTSCSKTVEKELKCQLGNFISRKDGNLNSGKALQYTRVPGIHMVGQESLKESQKLCGDGTWDGTAEYAGESCIGILSRTQSMEVGLGGLNSSQKQTLAQTPHDYPHLMEGKTTVTEEADCLLESTGKCVPR